MTDHYVSQIKHTVVVHFVLIFCSSLISLSLHYIVGGVWGFAPSTRDNFTTMHFVGPRPHDTKALFGFKPLKFLEAKSFRSFYEVTKIF